MKEGIWLCNMKVDDYNRLKPIYEPLQEVRVGSPAATNRYTVEELERMGFIGLYTTDNTSMKTFESLAINKTSRKRMRKEILIETVEDVMPAYIGRLFGKPDDDNDDMNLIDLLDD